VEGGPNPVWQEPTIQQPLACSRCGAELQGTPLAGFCNQCGRTVQATLVEHPLPPPPLAPSIVTDAPCVGCGYNVKSLELASKCPECGTPVEATLTGSLRYAPETYLRRLATATRCITLGMLFYSLGLTVFAAILASLDYFSTAGATNAVGGGVMLSTLIVTVPVIAMLFGYYLLTTPHPGIIASRQPTTARTLTRIAVGIAAAAALGSAITTIVAATRTGVTANAFAATGMMWSCLGCSGYWLLLGLLLPPVHIITWLCELDRSPEARLLAKRAKRSYWLLPVLVIAGPLAGYFLFVVAALGAAATTSTGTRSPDDIAMMLAIGAGCGTVIGSILAAMIYAWYIMQATGSLLRRCLAAHTQDQPSIDQASA
jgi:hypothetical protein